jgi:hypothetical protein
LLIKAGLNLKFYAIRRRRFNLPGFPRFEAVEGGGAGDMTSETPQQIHLKIVVDNLQPLKPTGGSHLLSSSRFDLHLAGVKHICALAVPPKEGRGNPKAKGKAKRDV